MKRQKEEMKICGNTTILGYDILPNDVKNIIDCYIMKQTLCYFDLINWHRTCTKKWEPLKNNLYCEYLKDIVYRVKQRIFILLVFVGDNIMEHYTNIRILEMIDVLCDAMITTNSQIRKLFKTENDTVYRNNWLKDGISLGVVNNVFPILDKQKDTKKLQQPITLRRAMKIYITYMIGKGFSVFIGNTRYDKVKKFGEDEPFEYSSEVTIKLTETVQRL